MTNELSRVRDILRNTRDQLLVRANVLATGRTKDFNAQHCLFGER
jgi:hypothetical protein